MVELVWEAAEADLPGWEPGAHVDLHLGEGLTRQYSLCGDPGERGRWRVAVRRADGGRGGSVFAHDRLSVGDVVDLGGPRNNFALVRAPEYLFVAGGIGITPLLPMIARAHGAGDPWRLLYLGRTVESMPYLDRLAGYGDRVTVWPSAQRGRPDLGDLLDELAPDAAVYCCGPESLLAALEKAGGERGLAVHLERFAPRPQVHGANVDFEVVMAQSRRTVTVTAGQSVLNAVNAAGGNVLSTCREGTCGTCEVRVLAGVPDHRDSVLTPDERAAGHYLMTCVSRSQTPSLTLDL